jgi:hypothetical protein
MAEGSDKIKIDTITQKNLSMVQEGVRAAVPNSLLEN